MIMTILVQERAASPSVLRRAFAVAIDICHAGGSFLARIIRIRRDRALLDELPDYLLRDIGIDRSEISSVTWFGSKAGSDGPWI
ncbi:DUF1127 domain-containing protein [Mesorhizobium sp. B3-1-3]|nr:DUF1127 domain-containing protein [Mesorhizobium sp. B3-1-8]TPI75983.1 DUF1127 domain-containing protein [Mesorhizobium sp. B3-1-3]TPJ36464.1 DUF1127 domain-containing protein [Mesorhizobium sp. B2-8-3]